MKNLVHENILGLKDVVYIPQSRYIISSTLLYHMIYLYLTIDMHQNILVYPTIETKNYNYSEVLGDIYLVSELLETDLNRVIKSKQKLKIEHIQYFLY